MSFDLPALSFSLDALSRQGMCRETLEYHYGKHHQTYVNTLNTLLEKNPDLAKKSLQDIILVSSEREELTPVFNNAGQHLNHSIFWNSLSPTGGRVPTKLVAKIKETFGGMAEFRDCFSKTALAQFGSGWTWLVLGHDGRIKVTKTANAVSPLSQKDGTILLTLDVWEHAYYIDYRNRRADYITNFLDHLANYEYAEAQMELAA